MNFEFSEEQQMLADMVDRFVADRYAFETRQKIMAGDAGWSRENWSALAELGLLGLPFAEEDGGFGGGGVETMIIMTALGRGLVIEPYLSTVVMAGAALRIAASQKQKAARIPAIIAGSHVMSLAHQEAAMPRHSFDVATTARRAGEGWRLDGCKISVPHGAGADELIVSARTEAGLALFLVPTTLPCVDVVRGTGYDGMPLATVTLADVALPGDALLGEPGQGEAIFARVFEEANAALVAEAVGAMRETFDLTTEYLKTRTQFDVPIGSFQALRHRLVDMLIELELSRSMAILAALSLDLPDDQRQKNISAAKVQVGRSGRRIGQEAVQMHGAIGITSEYKVGHAFKRLTAIDALLGDADHHIDLIADAGGLAA
ncbi:MAG: pimeloyl-CoA dehydrogenase small subunit [Sphingomonas sp.]|nr:pimeloyl-CoA dehydrogenase small subunit [Sphingomonas sp.]